MKSVTVKRTDLLDAIRANRDTHRDEFEKGLAGYKARLLEELEQRVTDLRAGRQIEQYIHLPIPEDHTRDYDAVIRMLEMEVAETVEIDQRTFAQYVMDDWAWKEQWVGTMSNYR